MFKSVLIVKKIHQSILYTIQDSLVHYTWYISMQMKIETEEDSQQHRKTMREKKMCVQWTSSIHENRLKKKHTHILSLYYIKHFRCTRDSNSQQTKCPKRILLLIVLLEIKQSSSKRRILGEIPYHTKKLTGNENFVTKVKKNIFSTGNIFFPLTIWTRLHRNQQKSQ